MNYTALAFDTETFLVEKGRKAPPLVCLSTCARSGFDGHPGTSLYHHTTASQSWLAAVKLALENNKPIVGAFLAFDMAVMLYHDPSLLEWIFGLYDAGLCKDVLIREKYIDIAQGGADFKYDLAGVTKKHLGLDLEKENTWRLRYSELYHLPLSQWPAEAVQYPQDDAAATLMVYEKQEAWREVFQKDEADRNRAAFFLHLMSVYGLTTNPNKVAAFRAETEARLLAVKGDLVKAGLVRENGKRDTKAAAARMLQVNPGAALTDKGSVCLDQEHCLASGDPIMIQYAEISKIGKIISTDLPILESGLIQTRFDPLLETGRTGSSEPNVQNPPRKGPYRECFEPRPGWVYIDADYPMLELHTWAEVCMTYLGHSRMAEVLNQGGDPHLAFAAQGMSISLEEATHRYKANDPDVKHQRDGAKPGNFGFPGGLGVNSFIEYCASNYGVHHTPDKAKELKQTWLSTWPEARPYADFINSLCVGPGQRATIVHLHSALVRSDLRYTQASNSLFQALGATVALCAGWLITLECYTDRRSPLYGSVPVNFVHDQFITETRIGPNMHDAAMRQAALMNRAAEEILHHVKMRPVEALLASCWSKKAKQVKGSDGRLAIWAPL